LGVRPTALLLDLDGTLVDSEPIHRAAYRAFFRGRGWAEPDLSLFTGRRAEDVFSVEPGPWTGLDVAELAAEVTALADAHDLAPDAVPGATALIDAAVAHDVPVALVTSAGAAWVDRTVGGSLAVLAHLSEVVTREDVADGKPHPAGYRLACERLGVPAAGALAVEDSPAGVRAALDAGVGTVVGVSTTHAADELVEAGAHEVLPDLTGLVGRVS
jgi:mannitol-1-/sugar-/sorbitol-6-phosphatase